ncbi:unnamed protein product [Cuscuta campestris]|uniref:CCHC-type domain-containing protein n=1 Tax=Cuscuta campestris TaxID=132261 RepID=A0A484MC64_9ASTE|nr:unnamed protein product [Cuscuta campestris]
MSQASTHGQGNTHRIDDEHVDVHTEGSSFVPQQNVEQPNVPQNVENHLNVGGQPDPVLPAFMMHFLQRMEQAQMFQPPPPPPPPPVRQVTLKMLKDNGAEEFLGDNIAEPQIAFDWLDQTTRVLKNLRIPEADRPELAVQLLRKGAYEWWKRASENAPEPLTWAYFDSSFQKEYIPPRFREGKRAEFVALSQGDMTLPEFQQRFDHLAQFEGTLVGTTRDRIEEFTTKLRPDIQPYRSAEPTIDFTAAYNQIEKAEKGLIAWKKSVAGSEEPSTQNKGVGTTGGKQTPGGGHSMQHSKKIKSGPAQSGASSRKPRPSRHPKCNLCRRNHLGECWFTQGLCLGCGKAGHFKRDCPTNPGLAFSTAETHTQASAARPTQSQRTTAGSNPRKSLNQNQSHDRQHGGTPAHTYAMQGRTEVNRDVILGMFSLFDTHMLALIDPGSTLSYICIPIPEKSDISRGDLEYPMIVSNPLEHSMRLHHMFQNCPLTAHGQALSANLIDLPYKEFDIILGMDWLTEHQAIIDCGLRTVRLKADDGGVIEVKGELFPKPPEFVSLMQAKCLIRKRCEAFLCNVRDVRKTTPELKDIPSVREFPEVFPDDLPGLPPPREVEFSVDLILGTEPISATPYRKANVVADALSRKTMAERQLQPTLRGEICATQQGDEYCAKTRELVSKGERQDFTIDNDGVLFYRDRLVVPGGVVRERLLREAHETTRYRSDPSHILPEGTVTLDESLSYEEEPVQILAREVKELRNKSIPLVKVLWRNHSTEEATWETEESMRTQYPHLFSDQ